MSSFTKIRKSAAGREHRERAQPANRRGLGLLEKKKDWLQRAKLHQKKTKELRKLRKKALERNTDEFHFHMLKSQVGLNGIHHEGEFLDEEQTRTQRLLTDIRDIDYVRHKLSAERKKIEKLRTSLHLTDSHVQLNTHTIFVDDVDDVRNFDPVKYFDTTEDLLSRRSNRLTVDKLESSKIQAENKATTLENEKQRHAQYDELEKRMERERELSIVLQKLEIKRELAQQKGKGKAPELISEGDQTKPAVYKFKFERKK